MIKVPIYYNHDNRELKGTLTMVEDPFQVLGPAIKLSPALRVTKISNNGMIEECELISLSIVPDIGKEY